MRALLTMTVMGTLFAVACSQNTSPIQPSSVPSATSSLSGTSSDTVTTSAGNRAALAVPAATQPHVPFKGTLQGQDVDSRFTGTTVDVTTTGTGIGTLLGKFSFTEEVTVTFASLTSAGSAQFTAANGDRIDTTVAGSGIPITPSEISITEVFTITGGTGRFADAQGSFTVERVASAITFTTSGSFEGTITSPGAAH
jgi:hypothetical protein